MTPDDRAISYEQWGIDFFAEAVNEERVLGAVNTIAGRAIEFGPMGAGPGRIAKVTAYGSIGEGAATRLADGQVSYRVLLPIDLTFEIELQGTQRFEAQLLVPLTLKAVALNGVRIFIEAIPPQGHEVRVELEPQGRRASLLQRVAGVEGELKRFVARYVATELDKPHVREARTIDVSDAIGHAWAKLAPVPDEDAAPDEDPPSGEVTDTGDDPVGA